MKKSIEWALSFRGDNFMVGMTKFEIKRLVNQYIGVSGGYLGDFSYRTHADFYAEYCDLDIDPNEYEGTTRSRFEHVLLTSRPRDQAKIVRGILAKYPPESDSDLRTKERHDEFLKLAQRLEATAQVGVPTLLLSRVRSLSGQLPTPRR